MTVVLVPLEIEASAMTVPYKVDDVPSVADEPTFQNTLQPLAPPLITMVLPDEVINELAAWNTQTEVADPVNCRVPERVRAPPE